MNKQNQPPFYTSTLKKEIEIDGKKIAVFRIDNENIDEKTVSSFSEEWKKFDSFNEDEISVVGSEYFDIVPENLFNQEETIALDLGCGTGRWSVYLADKVKRIDAIDPSTAIFSAAHLCKHYDNINLAQASASNIPFKDNTFDFAMSLGVLHHIPDTQKAMNNMVSKIKPGGFALLYLYYALDNRSFFYKSLFYASNLFRGVISKFPKSIKKIVCDVIAVTIYLPLITISSLLKSLGFKFYIKLPLSYYVNKSWNVIRNDALDRFGTPLEKRFTKEEIKQMMHQAGLTDFVFSEKMPFWHVLGIKSTL